MVQTPSGQRESTSSARDVEGASIASSTTSLFSTGSGKSIEVSEEAMSKASQVLAETPARISEVSKLPRKRSNCEPLCAQTPSVTFDRTEKPELTFFSTGSGKGISVSRAAMATASKILHVPEPIRSRVRLHGSELSRAKFQEMERPSHGDILNVTRLSSNKKILHRFVDTSTCEDYTGRRKFMKNADNVQLKTNSREVTHHAQVLLSVQEDASIQESRRITLKQLARCERLKINSKSLSTTGKLLDSISARAYKLNGNQGWQFFRQELIKQGLPPKIVTENWVSNHFRWIVWKAKAMEDRFPQTCKGRWLVEDRILSQH